MNILNLGQVVGVVTGLVKGDLDGKPHEQEHPLIQVVNASGDTVEHPAGPHLQLVHVPEEAQGLMDSLFPVDGQPLSSDDQDLANWIRLYQHIKADLADNGKVDQLGSHLAEVAKALHVQDVASGWASGMFDKLKSLVGIKK